MYTAYYLAKWSRYVRIRDRHICLMCQEPATSRRLMHAHHLDRKVDFPEKAVDLSNGVCLCADCHLRIVHSTEKHHKAFRHMYVRWNKRKAVREFNLKYQHRL